MDIDKYQPLIGTISMSFLDTLVETNTYFRFGYDPQITLYHTRGQLYVSMNADMIHPKKFNTQKQFDQK